MAGSSIKVGSVWKEITQPSVNVGGTWKTVNTIYANVSGTWKQVWPDVTLSVNSPDPIWLYAFDGVEPYNAWAQFTVDTDGDIYSIATNNDTGGSETSYGTWLTSGNASDVEVYLSGTGSAPSVGTLNTWLPLTFDRTWQWEQVGGGTKSFSGTLTFRNATTLATLDTAEVTIEVQCGLSI